MREGARKEQGKEQIRSKGKEEKSSNARAVVFTAAAVAFFNGQEKRQERKMNYVHIDGENNIVTIFIPGPRAIPSEANMENLMTTLKNDVKILVRFSDEGPILPYNTMKSVLR